MSNTQILNQGRAIFKEYGISYRFRRDHSSSGCYPKDSYVVIGYRGYTENEIASAITHELAHILNFRDKKYYNYHNYGMNTRITRNRVKNWIRIGLRAELYTDFRAKKLMKKFFPKHTFWAGYSDKTAQYWYKKEFIGSFKKFLGISL